MTQRGTVVIALSLLFFVSGYSRQDDIRVLAGLSLGQRPSAAPANVIVSRATRSGAETDSLGLKIDTVFAEWKYPQSPGGAIAIVKDGRLIFMKGYGCADLENAVAMTPSTKVYMASISKHFTGYWVARLIGDGKLNLNDDIRKYIPEMQSFGHAIKVKDRPMMIPAFLAKGSGTIALTWLYLLGTVSVQWIVIGAVDGIFAMFFAVAYWATGDHPKVRQLTSHPD